MPRYLFHTNRDSGPGPDDGAECPDLQAAKQLAVKYAAHALDDLGFGLFEDDFSVEVSNSDGLLLFTITAFVTEAPAI